MKLYKSSINREVPVEQIVCRVKVCGETFGGAWCPHGSQWGYGEKVDLSLDDLSELYEFRAMVNKFVDSLEEIMQGHQENSIELFKVRGEKS